MHGRWKRGGGGEGRGRWRLGCELDSNELAGAGVAAPSQPNDLEILKTSDLPILDRSIDIRSVYIQTWSDRNLSSQKCQQRPPSRPPFLTGAFVRVTCPTSADSAASGRQHRSRPLCSRISEGGRDDC